MYVYHVTVANKNNKFLELLKKSAEINNIKTIVLGLHLSGIQIGQLYGFGWKLMLLRDFISNMNDDDIVLFTDAYDVIFCSSMHEVMKKFLSFKSQIVFSAEKYCSPDQTLAKFYNKVDERPNYLNSGVFMGYVGALKKLYDENAGSINVKTDDQDYYTKTFLRHQNEKNFVCLDYDSKIFMCLAGCVDLLVFDEKNKRMQNKQTGEFPCIIHGNGATKTAILDLYNLMYQHDYPLDEITMQPQVVPRVIESLANSRIIDNSLNNVFLLVLVLCLSIILFIVAYKGFAN